MLGILRGRGNVHLHCGNCQYFILENAIQRFTYGCHLLFAKFVGGRRGAVVRNGRGLLLSNCVKCAVPKQLGRGRLPGTWQKFQP